MNPIAVPAVSSPGTSTLCTKPLRHSLVACALGLGALVPGAGALAASGGDQKGVFADGSISYLFVICSTCSQPSDILFTQSAGRVGSRGPAGVDGHEGLFDGFGDVWARAQIVRPEAVPDLRATAKSTPGLGTHAGFSGIGNYYFNTVASARGLQYYTYAGAVAQTYTMNYTLTGDARTLRPNPTDADRSLISVSGGLALFNDKNNNLELPFGELIDIHQSAVSGSDNPFRESGSVSITVQPGDSYYLSAFLAAGVSYYGYGIADASHTLSVDFTAGNTSQLIPALLPVPEPSTYALFALGLVLTGIAARRCGR